MSATASELTEFFARHIPSSVHMGLQVESYDGDNLVVVAPLPLNCNHHGTAFGGSLYNAAVLAGWGFSFLKTKEASLICDQVVANASISYRAPVAGEIRAVCKSPGVDAIAEYIERFKQQGRARISLQATIHHEGELAVQFEGEYAIVRPG